MRRGPPLRWLHLGGMGAATVAAGLKGGLLLPGPGLAGLCGWLAFWLAVHDATEQVE